MARKGEKLSEEAKKKISESLKGRIPWNKNIGHTKETKEKIRNTLKGFKHTDTMKQKISEIHKNREFSEEQKKNLRLSAIKRAESQRKFKFSKYQRLGKNETAILNNIEEKTGIKIERQKQICGYFVDGYDGMNNTVYEVDEAHHFVNGRLSEKDTIRQNRIMKEIKCSFIRIKDLGGNLEWL